MNQYHAILFKYREEQTDNKTLLNIKSIIFQ